MDGIRNEDVHKQFGEQCVTLQGRRRSRVHEWAHVCPHCATERCSKTTRFVMCEIATVDKCCGEHLVGKEMCATVCVYTCSIAVKYACVRCVHVSHVWVPRRNAQHCV